MLAVLKTINPPPKRINAPKKKSSTRTLLGLTSLDLSFFNTSKIPKPQTRLEKTIKIIGVIEGAFC